MLEIYLPLFHFHLLAVVLLDEILQYFPETLRIRLQCRHNILHRSLNENAIYHPEAFPVGRKGFKGFKNELCVYAIAVSGGFSSGVVEDQSCSAKSLELCRATG